jgi:hypothetical protein
MKRRFIFASVVTLTSLFLSTSVHAQAKVYTNSEKMTYAYDLGIYYNQHRHNLTAAAAAVPEDKFFATPPGVTKENASEEQLSIGHQVAHAADANERMCLLISTGKQLPDGQMVGELAMAAKPRPTKAGVMAALAKSYEVCDPIVAAFKDSKVADMVMSQHGLKPLGTTLHNTTSHIREVNGRILSYMAVFGIKSGGRIEAIDPKNPKGIQPR